MGTFLAGLAAADLTFRRLVKKEKKKTIKETVKVIETQLAENIIPKLSNYKLTYILSNLTLDNDNTS